MGKIEEQLSFWDYVVEPFRDAKRQILKQKSLPPYTKQDVQEFIRSEPVYGPQLKKLNQSTTFCYAGAAVVGTATAALSRRCAKRTQVAVLAVVGGGVVGLALGEEAANYALGLYKFNRREPKKKFLEWWEKQQS